MKLSIRFQQKLVYKMMGHLVEFEISLRECKIGTFFAKCFPPSAIIIEFNAIVDTNTKYSGIQNV